MFKKKTEKEIDLKCPRCNIVMRKIKKADVIIDVCENCNGMWLDDGEIDKIMAFPEVKHGKKK